MPLYKLALLVSLSLASSTALASDDWRDIRLQEGRRASGKDDVLVRGSWKALGDYAKPRIPRINAMALTCTRERMQCIESLAYVKQLGPQPSSRPPDIFSLTSEYEIKEWSSQRIVAARVNPRGFPIDSTVVIPLGKGNVRIDWREPDGENVFVPQVQSYEIELTLAF